MAIARIDWTNHRLLWAVAIMRAIIEHGFPAIAARHNVPRPDYTLPLRLQTSGQSAAVRESIEIRRMLWARALSDGWIWRRACWLGLLIGMIEIALDLGTNSLPPWAKAARVLFLAALAVGVGVISAAGSRVSGQMSGRRLSIN